MSMLGGDRDKQLGARLRVHEFTTAACTRLLMSGVPRPPPPPLPIATVVLPALTLCAHKVVSVRSCVLAVLQLL